ncbi:MAG: hypothetical protein JNL70_14150 [Saprospiraceae bacterium]|nr:hypothetical protein [Saprospiraceae bacterium]
MPNILLLLKRQNIMPTSYSRFKIEDLFDLNIKIERNIVFNGNIDPIEPSELLKATIKKNLSKNLASEKAKSEFLISPIVAEIAENNVDTMSFYSGYQFDVDKTHGLRGFCDFIFSLEPRALIIMAPFFCVVEAKNENLDLGIPQCIAEMYAAWLFNQRKGRDISTIYGVVTYGYAWQFLRFSNMKAELDETVYSLSELPKILGILQHIIDLQKRPLSTEALSQ